jgi:hypothetical protein
MGVMNSGITLLRRETYRKILNRATVDERDVIQSGSQSASLLCGDGSKLDGFDEVGRFSFVDNESVRLSRRLGHGLRS